MPQWFNLELRNLFFRQVSRQFLRFRLIGNQGQLDVVDLRQAVHQSSQMINRAFPRIVFLVVDVRRKGLDDVDGVLAEREGDQQRGSSRKLSRHGLSDRYHASLIGKSPDCRSPSLLLRRGSYKIPWLRRRRPSRTARRRIFRSSRALRLIPCRGSFP